MKLFAKGPEGKDEKPGSLAGEVVFVAADKDVKVWKKAGEWYVLSCLAIIREALQANG